MKNNNFKPNYIKCPDCKNILDLSFASKSCPNPLCGFNFAGLEAFLNKNDEELYKDLLKTYKNPESLKYKLITTAIKYNIGSYLAHFIECSYNPHYNAIYKGIIVGFFDDLNILKIVLESDIIKEKENIVISKNGYKMFWKLYCHLKSASKTADLRNFLITEFPDFHRKYYNEWFLKWESIKKEKIKKKQQKQKILL